MKLYTKNNGKLVVYEAGDPDFDNQPTDWINSCIEEARKLQPKTHSTAVLALLPHPEVVDQVA